MILNIKTQKKFNLDPFLKEWLIPALRNNLKSNIIKNKEAILYHYKKETYQNLLLAANCIDLQHTYSLNNLIISINQNEKNMEGTAKLYDICAMVNFGSLSKPAIPIFTKTFNYFAKKFWIFYRDYNLGILKRCP